MGKPIAFVLGTKFGRLTVKRALGVGGRLKRGRQWLCQCDCGNEIVTHGGNLNNGNVRSCGCLQLEQSIAVCKARITHGMRHKAVYKAFYSAKNRCNSKVNIMYPIYGGLGVKFKFSSFDDWYKELGPRPSSQHSVDRIDPYGHYEPGNIRWATRKEQQHNKRADHAARKIAALEAEIAVLKAKLNP